MWRVGSQISSRCSPSRYLPCSAGRSWAFLLFLAAKENGVGRLSMKKRKREREERKRREALRRREKKRRAALFCAHTALRAATARAGALPRASAAACQSSTTTLPASGVFCQRRKLPLLPDARQRWGDAARVVDDAPFTACCIYAISFSTCSCRGVASVPGAIRHRAVRRSSVLWKKLECWTCGMHSRRIAMPVLRRNSTT